MLNVATDQFAVNDKETPGKERDDNDDDDDANEDHDDADETDATDHQSQQPELQTDDWKPVLYASLPDWLRDNELIESGHRPQLRNFYSCLLSVFRVHSETGSIWTHLIGTIIVGVLALEHLLRPHTATAWQEKTCFSVFYASMLSCFAYSFVCHTFCCHSQSVLRYLLMLDYVGIVMAITGSLMPWLYYGYHCRLETQATHVALSLSLGVVCLVYIAVMFDEFILQRCVKAGVFLSLGLTCLVPAIHLSSLIGHHDSFMYLALFGLSYVTGAVVYATRIPESIWPGRFNTWFGSHQLFHIFCVVAVLLEYRGLLLVAEDRLRFGGCLTHA